MIVRIGICETGVEEMRFSILEDDGTESWYVGQDVSTDEDGDFNVFAVRKEEGA